MPELPVKIMMNVGNPERAFAFAALRTTGGAARIEFVINRMIGVHPRRSSSMGACRPPCRRRSDDARPDMPIR